MSNEEINEEALNKWTQVVFNEKDFSFMYDKFYDLKFHITKIINFKKKLKNKYEKYAYLQGVSIILEKHAYEIKKVIKEIENE